MGKDKLKNRTVEQLQKGKKIGLFAIALLITAIILDGGVIIYDLIIGDGFNTILFVPAAACFVILIPIYLGRKRIEEELKKRESR